MELKKKKEVVLPLIPYPLNIEDIYIDGLQQLVGLVNDDIQTLAPFMEDNLLITDSFEDELSFKVGELKTKYTDLESYERIATLFVNSINMYSFHEVHKEINKKFPDTPVSDLSYREAQSHFVGEAYRESLAENVKLIKSIPEKYLSQVEKLVDENYRKGKSINLQEELTQRFDITLRRAHTIARDQTAKVTAGFNEARFRSYGVTDYVWAVADKSDRTRETHLHANGKIYSYSEGAPNGHGGRMNPSDEINCRCHALAVIPKDLF